MKKISLLMLGLFALTAHAKDGGEYQPSGGENQPSEMSIETGVFEPSWQSLSANYQAPQWFADAKLGIWAHWGLQCVPEAGDWYARAMYQQEQGKYREHCKRYGHPSEFGMMDFIPMWKAEKFDACPSASTLIWVVRELL